MRPSHPRRLAGVYLAQRTRFGVKFGLDTIRALVDEMGHPEESFTTLLVAGTNGKGSVVAYADSILRASGLRTGRYTSPHLVRVNERIAVNGRDITDHDFERAVRTVRAAAERLVRRGVIPAHPTFFEALTAAAFVHFRRKRVDVAVLEVGLGGRLDATNVVEPVASAVVSVAHDHQVYLGKTLGSIAREKAGVMRPHRPTIVGPLPAEAWRAVESRGRAQGARLIEASRGAVITPGPPGQDLVDIRTPYRGHRGLRHLPGAHQRDNLLVALRLLEEARGEGLDVDLDDLAGPVARTRWPGRLEWIDGDPPLLLDAAHNPAGARALARHLAGRSAYVLLFSTMNDKDVAGIARPLFPRAVEVVLTRPHLPRALDPGELARSVGALAASAHRQPQVSRALALACRLGRQHRAPVVVAGTLFLVGEVKGLLEPPGRGTGAGGRQLPHRKR